MIEKDRQKVLKEGIEEGFYPRYLYYYSSFEKAKQLLKNNTLKYSSYREFNDPFEGSFGLVGDVSRDEIKKFVELYFPAFLDMPLDSITYDYLKRIMKDLIIDSISQVGIFCMSQINNNLLMWAHYADEHQGVCIKFDLLKDLEAFSSLHKVVYTTGYLNFNLITDFPRVNDILIHKSVDWMYEKEFRVLKINKVGFGIFNPEAIVEIDFGCRMTMDNKKAIKEIISNNSKYNIQFKQAAKHTNDYRILICDEDNKRFFYE